MATINWELVAVILTAISTAIAGSVGVIQKIRGPTATPAERTARREARQAKPRKGKP